LSDFAKDLCEKCADLVVFTDAEVIRSESSKIPYSIVFFKKFLSTALSIVNYAFIYTSTGDFMSESAQNLQFYAENAVR
jgi:hypothetical protein